VRPTRGGSEGSEFARMTTTINAPCGSAHGERGKREGMRGRRKLVVFWSIKYKKHIEGVRSGMFRRVVIL